jgi:Ca-activated chloride channel family protein
MDATYTFPLSDRSAVDEMIMRIGSRTIAGNIKESDEARAIYEQARMSGYSATLLEQERTNVFTQSIANIDPNQPIDVTVKYSEPLAFNDGQYSLVFPTSVGPRFIPAGCTGDPSKLNSSSVVADASPVQVHVDLDEGGIPITKIFSPTHSLSIHSIDSTHSDIALSNNTANGKDIVIDWQMASGEIQSGYLTHKDGSDGFLMAMLMPPKKVEKSAVAPKELMFIVDCSGSQAGEPLDKAKETLNYMVDHMGANDTFQILAFNTELKKFSARPVLVSADMKRRAHSFISQLEADGGTAMAPAIEAACATRADAHRLRIVSIMTDGYIGNDEDILAMVKKLRGNSRWFPFGTGNSVNRALIDGIATEGGGEPEYALLDVPGAQIAKHFYERIASPILTDIKLSWDGVELRNVYPQHPSDLWDQKPLYFQARYSKAGSGELVINGFYQGKPYTQRLHVVLPDKIKANASVAQVWARARIDELMSKDWSGAQSGNIAPEIKEEIVDTSLRYHVLSQFTAFVAVDSLAQAPKPVNPEASVATNAADENKTASPDAASTQFRLPFLRIQLPSPGAIDLQFGLLQNAQESLQRERSFSECRSVTKTIVHQACAAPASNTTGLDTFSTNYTANTGVMGSTYSQGSGSDAAAGAGGNTLTQTYNFQSTPVAAPHPLHHASLDAGHRTAVRGAGYFSTTPAAKLEGGLVPPPPSMQEQNAGNVTPSEEQRALGLPLQNALAFGQYVWLVLSVIALAAAFLKRSTLKKARFKWCVVAACFLLIALALPDTVGWLLQTTQGVKIVS